MRLRIARIRLLMILAVAVTRVLIGDESHMKPPSGVAFEIVSVRIMSTKESLKRSPPDVFGLDVVVRLRLVCAGSGIYFLTTRDPVQLVPQGHAVKLTKGEVIWRHGTSIGGESTISPGSGRICDAVACDWVSLPAHSALEWEELDVSSARRETRAYSIFIKQSSDGAPHEIISTSFTAPITNASVRHE